MVRDKLSQLCAAASEAWKEFETAPDAQEQRSGAASNGHKATSDGEPAAFDSEVHARGLYDRALNAFEKAQYWDAIQLVREAIAADEHVAEYYALHGRALLQNEKWHREAADALLKAMARLEKLVRRRAKTSKGQLDFFFLKKGASFALTL